MRYVVTGGAGFIGSHLATRLVDEGHDVVILDNFSTGRKKNIASLCKGDRVQCVEGSVTDFQLLVNLFEGADGVFHQAAVTSVQESIRCPFATHKVNATGTLNVLQAACDLGVGSVVFASSAAVYGNNQVLPLSEWVTPIPLSPYAVSKLTAEHYAKVFADLYGIKTVALRYFNVYGPRQDPNSEYAAVIPKFITRALRGEPLRIYGDGEQTRDFVYVQDVVEANIRAMESQVTGVFNVATGQQTSLNRLAAIVGTATGTDVKTVYAPPRAGEVRYSWAYTALAREELGFVSQYTIQSGIEATVEWFRERSRI